MAGGETREPAIVIVRHGDTEWSQNGRHTSTTDLPLLASGVEHARELADVLDPEQFALVLSSPMERARHTAELAGFEGRFELDPDLHEWNYGDYEGLTTPEIDAQRPGWSLWRQGAPHGESPADVAARADRLIQRALHSGGDSLMFAHGHFLRVLAARWVGQGPEFGSRMYLQPATISKLGHEHARRVIERWNSNAL